MIINFDKVKDGKTFYFNGRSFVKCKPNEKGFGSAKDKAGRMASFGHGHEVEIEGDENDETSDSSKN